jgi:hypothetical protein
MLPEKNMLSLEEIDEQSALELPQRELLTLYVFPRVDIDVTKITLNSNVEQQNWSFISLGSLQNNSATVSQNVHV